MRQCIIWKQLQYFSLYNISLEVKAPSYIPNLGLIRTSEFKF